MDNNKKLSIIITHHNEDDSLIIPLLQSINNQRGINFDDIEIIISNNCDTPKFPQILNNFPNIQDRIACINTDIKNKLGYSREFAVKQCHGEWIIFCDCDDALYCDYTLMEILSQVDNSIDMYHCKELHEVCNENGEIHTVVEGRNYVFLHGKIFKANCLKSIPFNQSVLSDHEDIYTCLYLNGLRVNEAELDLIIYVWRYNKNSVTRINDSEHDYLGLPDLIRCYQYIYDDLKQNGKDLIYHKTDILDFIYYKYRQIKMTKLKSDKNELEALLSYFILSFDPEFDCLQRENPTFGNEPYVDFIHRITKEFTENIHPYWTKYYLYDNYYPVWDIQIKNFRESIRLSYHYFLTENYTEALTYAKKAFELNSISYQSNLMLGICLYNVETNKEIALSLIKYGYNQFVKSNFSEYDDVNILSDGYLFDTLALLFYTEKEYEYSLSCGTLALSNFPNDDRLKYNLFFYKNKANGGNRAWITLLSDNSYIYGQIALVHGLKEHGTIYPIYCMVTDNVTEENKNILKALDVQLIETERFVPDNYKVYSEDEWNNAHSLSTAGWHNALTKLKIFNLAQFDKIVYIDNDTQIFKNLDFLFDCPHMSAVQDTYGKQKQFCSGLMVIEPSHELYDSLMEHTKRFMLESQMISNAPYPQYVFSGLIHDQLILQTFYNDWHLKKELHLPIYCHTWTTYFSDNNSNIDELSNVYAMHYIDAKPWKVGKQYFIDMQEQYPVYSRLTLEYIKKIESYVNELKERGICPSNMGMPD